MVTALCRDSRVAGSGHAMGMLESLEVRFGPGAEGVRAGVHLLLGSERVACELGLRLVDGLIVGGRGARVPVHQAIALAVQGKLLLDGGSLAEWVMPE